MEGERWIDAESAGRSLGVTGMTVRRWCLSGLVSRWRTLGLGVRRRYQVAETALAELRQRFVREHGSHNPNNPNTGE